jgi:hypothetical protein
MDSRVKQMPRRDAGVRPGCCEELGTDMGLGQTDAALVCFVQLRHHAPELVKP